MILLTVFSCVDITAYCGNQRAKSVGCLQIKCFNFEPSKIIISLSLYSGRRLMGPPRDQPFLFLISGWSYYPAGLFSQKIQMFFKKWSH